MRVKPLRAICASRSASGFAFRRRHRSAKRWRQHVLVAKQGRMGEFGSTHLSRSALYETTCQNQASVPPLSAARAVGTLSKSHAQEWALRGLDLVFSWRKAGPAALRPPQGPGHTGPTALPRPPQHLLQKVQPLADAGRTGCLHGCRGEASEPLPSESVGSVDRPAVLGSERRRAGKRECQAVKGQNCPATASTTEGCTINLGDAPDTHRTLTGVPPSADGPDEEGANGKWACGTQKE